MSTIKFTTPTPIKGSKLIMTPQAAGQTEGWAAKMYEIDYLHNLGMTGKGVRIGVIDTGIDIRHKDLNIKKENLFDFTGEGYSRYKARFNGHGLGSAGVIGAINNNFGIKGWAYGCEIYGLKALTEAGQGDLSWITAAVEKAIELDLDIINLSIGSTATDHRLEEVLLRFKNSGKNKFIVAASGNLGPDYLATYPARYPFVISVGSHNNSREISDFTSDLNDTVDYYLPGEDILTCWAKDSYVRTSGTSFSAPLMTGFIACFISGGYEFTLDGLKEATQGLKIIDIPQIHSYLEATKDIEKECNYELLKSVYTELAERHFALGQSLDKFKELLDK